MQTYFQNIKQIPVVTTSSNTKKNQRRSLSEIEHLKGKIGEGDFEKLRDLLNRTADVFSKHKADIGCCNFVEHEIELEEGAVPHREGARRMTPHKPEACRAKIEMLLEYDMIESSKSPSGLRGSHSQEEGAAQVLLQLSIPERSDNKT